MPRDCSISAPPVIVSGRRVVAARRKVVTGVPIDFDISDVAIYETDHVLSIVNPFLS